MSRIERVLCAAAVALALPLTACSSQPAEQSQPASDEQAIRKINSHWLELIRSRDAAGVAGLYAPNGALMPPNSPAALGTEAIQKGWQGMFDMPGFALTFEPDEIVVSGSGDLAYDRGTYKFAAAPASGPVTEDGKYVVVWRKLDGQWRAVADIFNSNAPAP